MFLNEGSPNETLLEFFKTEMPAFHFILSKNMKRKSNYINGYFKISWANKPVYDLRRA